MNILKYTDLAFEIAGNILAPPIVGIFAGRFIDQYFKTGPLFLLIFLFLGIMTGLRSLYILWQRLASSDKIEKK